MPSAEQATERRLFFAGETSGAITDTVTIASGASEFVGREFIEQHTSADEVVLYATCSDDDGQAPTIRPYIALYNGSGFMAWQPMADAQTAPCAFLIAFYGEQWWIRNAGFKIKFVKTGSGAVTITGANAV